MNQKKVSVLMPAYNSRQWIEESIESVLNQAWKNIELIIVDDGSTDDTYEIAKRYECDNVIVVQQKNGGQGSARNHAFLLSTGDYIQYLDSDDYLDKYKIYNQMKYLDDNEFTIFSSAWGTFFDNINNPIISINKLNRDYEDPTEWLLTAWNGGMWMPNFVWLTSRSLIENAGPWDEIYRMHDGEFFCRVLIEAKKIKYCDDSLGLYRKGISNSLSSLISYNSIKIKYKVCESYELNLLAKRNDIDARIACANNYENLVFDYYPVAKNILRKAEQRAKKLGGGNVSVSLTRKQKFLAGFFGWKFVKKIIYLKKKLYNNH